MSITQKIQDAIKVECDRQQVGEDRRQRLEAAYLYLAMTHHEATLQEQMLKRMAFEIEPDNGGEYRKTPVTIRGGVQGCINPSLVLTVMPKWIDFFNTEHTVWKDHPDSHWRRIHAEYVIKEFLDIHPFSDGNGRTAWLLRVWMLNQWDDPQPLPDYYGE